MINLNYKRIISGLLVLIILASSFAVSLYNPIRTFAQGMSVTIVSFTRGEQADLRSSELLEARVTGYDGNVQDLTYEWTNDLGTYLYVYNSHNMYFINNTDGEIEVYNDSCDASANMSGRAYKDSFSGKGYAWAAVYGYNVKSNNKLSGSITVTVKDSDGNVLCSDTHTGKVSSSGSFWRPTYTYSGIVPYDLETDMDDVTIGLFEGDKRNVKDLLGESAIVHITCVESSVSNGSIVSGSDHINLTKESGEYYITGTYAGESSDISGDARVSLTIKKGNCKFHYNESGTATTTVFVFKKPTTSTTTTTLTLTGNLDSRCSYYIHGIEGTVQSDGTILFTGLTPNTDYEVEVRGKYIDENGNTKYAYAYVYDTTKPVYSATVNILLDGVLTDLDVVHDGDTYLYLRKVESEDRFEVRHTSVGTYVATVENGTYYPCHIDPDGHYHQVTDHQLIIENANSSINLNHYSVRYDTDGGYFEADDDPGIENFFSGSSVTASSSIPQKEGWVFAGWEYNGNTLLPSQTVTNSITSPIVLKAIWTRSIDVTVNVILNHKHGDSVNDSSAKDDVTVELLYRTDDSTPYFETDMHLVLSKDSHELHEYTTSWDDGADQTDENVILTQYTATAPTFTGLSESFEYGVLSNKSGYDVVYINKSVDPVTGCWTIDICLEFNPDDFDIGFSVEMDSDVPKELYPKEVITKLVYWCQDHEIWEVFPEQAGTKPGIHLHLDPETGKASGSYPVWTHDSHGDLYGYRFVITAFVYQDGTIVPTTDMKDGYVMSYTDKNYTGYMSTVDDGAIYGDIYGAYFDEETAEQTGTLHAVIDVEKYSVTFDAMGGTVNGLPSQTVDELYYVPSFGGYPATNGDHAFYGWYLDPAHTIPAVEGALLTEDITLYAKYGRNLHGTVKIAGTYFDNGHEIEVIPSDRPTSCAVVLQEITPDGVYTIANQHLTITWEDGLGISEEYYFYDLYQYKEYRIDVLLLNYTTEFQNSQTYIDGNGDINNDYNSEDYRVIYTDENPLLTFVNAYLHFRPDPFFQEVTVDATMIGEGFRPDSTLVEILGRETGSGVDFDVIIQHRVDPFGIVVGMNESGLSDGTYGEDVWKEKFNGNLYDYQARLSKYDSFTPDELPIQVSYGNVSRWSPLNDSATEVLKVVIMPKDFIVHFDLDVPADTVVTGMDNYFFISTSGERGYQTRHTWSYSTPISAVPSREGYRFVGWTCETPGAFDGEKVSAAVHENITLKALWEPSLADLKIRVEGTDSIDANQSYIFDIYDEDSNLVVTVTIHGDETVTVKDLPVKTYTVVEQNGWSWRYTPVDENDEDPASQEIVLSPSSENTVDYIMERIFKYWLDGDNYKVNIFGPLSD